MRNFRSVAFPISRTIQTLLAATFCYNLPENSLVPHDKNINNLRAVVDIKLNLKALISGRANDLLKNKILKNEVNMMHIEVYI